MLLRSKKTIPVLLSSILVACGGGSGDSTVPVSQTTTPTSSTTGVGDTGTTPSATTSQNTNASNPGAATSSPPTDTSTPVQNGWNYDQSARFTFPAQMARDSEGNVYVRDAPVPTFAEPSSESERIRKIATNGDVTTLPDTYLRIAGLAASGTSLFVAAERKIMPPPQNSGFLSTTDIIKIEPDGTRTTLATYPIGPGTSNPIALSADALGHVYVTREYRTIFAVDRIDPDGTKTVVYTFSTFGDFYDVTSDAQGTLTISLTEPGPNKYLVYVPLSAQPAVQSTNPNDSSSIPHPPGVVVRQVGVADQIGYDAADNLYIFSIATSLVDQGTASAPATYRLDSITVKKMAHDGSTTTLYDGLPDGITTQFSAGYYPRDLVVTPNGDAYISLPIDHTVFKITGDGKATLVAGKSGEAGKSD